MANFTYFTLGIGKSYLYYSFVNFASLHTGDILALIEKQQVQFGLS